MKKFFVLLASILLFASFAQAQSFATIDRTATVSTYHTTVDTTTAALIPSASIYSNIIGFKVCNDPVNASSTYLILGTTVDAATDGIRLDKGQCFVCDSCKSRILSGLKVKGQGSTNGYSVIQYRP
jgi:hypothetical protein